MKSAPLLFLLGKRGEGARLIEKDIAYP